MHYPLFFDLSGKTVVVVGGGTVGRRRALKLRDAGAVARIVDPARRPGDLPDDIAWVEQPFAPRHLGDAVLAFGCATAAVNREVVAAARSLRIPVHSASEPAEGDFQVPAVFAEGPLQIAVHTGGAGPAAAKHVVERLATLFDEAYFDWLALQAELRPLILERIAVEADRREIFLRLASPETLERVRGGAADAIRGELCLPGPRTK